MRKTKALKKLAKRITELKDREGISSEKLAFLSDLSKSEVRYIERGERDPKVSTLEKIANGLEVPLKELFDF